MENISFSCNQAHGVKIMLLKKSIIHPRTFLSHGQELQVHPITKKTSNKYNPQESSEPPRVVQNRYAHSTSMVHPSIAGSWGKPSGASRNGAELKTQKSQKHQSVGDLSISSLKKEDSVSTKDSGMV